jgi:hypothetical protein
MPVGVVQGEPEHFDLKTLPGGFVKIKRMNYGEKMTRRQFSSKMEMETDRRTKSMKSIVDLFKEDADLYDFAHCVTDHNLTDVDERPLDFNNPTDVRKLAGKIAEEIGTYIDSVNNFEETEEVGNS